MMPSLLVASATFLPAPVMRRRVAQRGLVVVVPDRVDVRVLGEQVLHQAFCAASAVSDVLFGLVDDVQAGLLGRRGEALRGLMIDGAGGPPMTITFPPGLLGDELRSCSFGPPGSQMLYSTTRSR